MPPMLPQDKANHVFYGALIAAVVLFLIVAVSVLLAHFGVMPRMRPLYAIGAAALVNVTAAWAKEWIYDKARPTEHTVDPMDFVATVAGGLLVVVPALALWGLR